MRGKVPGISVRGIMAAGTGLMLWSGSVAALEEGKNEKDNLRACERRVCDIFLKKSMQGDDLKCGLVKTWAKSSIKNGVETGKISWTNGDARCEMELNLSRPELVAAMTAPSHHFKFPEHTIKCAIEEDKSVRQIRVVLAPEVEFKGGVATSGKVRVKKVDAPFLMKTGIWTAATMIDKLGVFEKKLLTELNKLAQKRCPEHYGKPEVVAVKKAGPAKPAAKKAEGEKAKPAEGEKKEAKAESKGESKPEAKTNGKADAAKADASKTEAKKAEPVQAGAVAAPVTKPAAKPESAKTEDAKKAEPVQAGTASTAPAAKE